MNRNLIVLSALSFSFLFAGNANATSCSLNGVDFYGLTVNQVNVLDNVGGSCTHTEVSDFKYGEKGYYKIDGQEVEAIDVAANDPYDMVNVEAKFYGYIDYTVNEKSRNQVWGYMFGTSMNAGEVVKAGSETYLRFADISIPLLISADQSKDTAESAKADRIKYFKLLNNVKGLDGAVKVTGFFKTIPDTGDLYMHAENIEIIEMKPE